MRSLFPSIRWLLAAGLCASVIFAAGCAPREQQAITKKPAPLFVEKPKPKSATVKPVLDVQPKKPVPQFIVDTRGVTLNWSAKEGTQMTANAKSASFNEVTQSGTLLDFSAKLYENGKLTAAVSAPLAEADTKKRTVTASGGVTLKSFERKTVVTAKWIRWYANTHKLVGNGGVKIVSESGTIDGAAFVADTALKTLTVKDSGKGLEF